MTPDAADHVVQRHRGLLGRTILVSGLTLVSRLLGYLRESVMAAMLGDTSGISDAFTTAWRVPNLFRRLLGEGAMSTSMQTALTEVDAGLGNDAGRELFARTVRITTWILLAVTAAVMLAAWAMPDEMPGTGWRWLGDDPDAVRELTIRLIPFVITVCLAALFAGALQVRGEFLSSSLAPAVLNVVWIAALFWLLGRHGAAEASDAPGGIGGIDGIGGPAAVGPAEGEGELGRSEQMSIVRTISWAVLVAGVLQLAVQMPALRRYGLLGRALASTALSPQTLADVRARVWSVLTTSAPLALGAAVYQVNVMVDGWMAQAMLPEGGPTTYHYATRIQQFPVALIATAATSSVFPSLKALAHLGRREELRALHDRAQLAVAYLALPATLGLIVLASPICAVLLQHGRFEQQGVDRTSAALALLSLAILPAGAAGLVSRIYYALGDLRTPVRVSVACLALNVILNTCFVAGLGMDTGGFALATAISSWVNLALLLPGLTRRLALPGGSTAWVPRLVAMAAAAGLAGAAAWGVWWVCMAGAVAHGARGALVLALAIAVSAAAYGGASGLLGLPEWRAMTGHLLRLLGRRRGGQP